MVGQVGQVVECHVAERSGRTSVKKTPRVWLLGLKLGGKPQGKPWKGRGVGLMMPYSQQDTICALVLRDFPCTSLTVAPISGSQTCLAIAVTLPQVPIRIGEDNVKHVELKAQGNAHTHTNSSHSTVAHHIY